MRPAIGDMSVKELHDERARILKRLALLRKVANNYRRRLGTITTVLKGKAHKEEA